MERGDAQEKQLNTPPGARRARQALRTGRAGCAAL
jgi:hypothetical protein